MTPCGPAETSMPLSGLKNWIRGSCPAPDGSGSFRQVTPRSSMTRNPVRPANCGPDTSHSLVLQELAAAGSTCDAQVTPPSRLTSSASDREKHAPLSQPADAVANASPTLSQETGRPLLPVPACGVPATGDQRSPASLVRYSWTGSCPIAPPLAIRSQPCSGPATLRKWA